MTTGTTIGEEIRVWHERNHCGKRTGRTIAFIWDEDLRYVGVSICGKKDQFNKKIGWGQAVSRAHGAINLLKLDARCTRDQTFHLFPKVFYFSLKQLGSLPEVDHFLKNIPEHLYKEKSNEHSQADRSQLA